MDKKEVNKQTKDPDSSNAVKTVEQSYCVENGRTVSEKVICTLGLKLATQRWG